MSEKEKPRDIKERTFSFALEVVRLDPCPHEKQEVREYFAFLLLTFALHPRLATFAQLRKSANVSARLTLKRKEDRLLFDCVA